MAQEEKHIPTRMCCICRTRVPKKLLTRFVQNPVTALPVLDQFQKAQARGVYVCQDARCQEAFSRRKAIRKERGRI